jgi:murein DD-endopeptidase MepM/ murein hydrolase activator NlpD
MSRRRTIDAYRLALAGFVGFLAGVIVTVAVVRDQFDPRRRQPVIEPSESSAADASPSDADRVLRDAVEPAVLAPKPTPRLEADPIPDLRDRRLLVPVQGVTRTQLRGSFDEERGSDRKHEAMDILAERNTPVLAVERGTIARLFASDRGGITVYQFDPTTTYVYYYAHLEGYASGLKEGVAVKAGQVLGYVGTSGNAPKDTPHLHFAIFKLTEKKRWWEGVPIDPYLVLQ